MTTIRQLIQTSPAKANELFAKLAETSENAVKTRERLFADLKEELELLARLEEDRANRRLGCSRTLSRIELRSPGGLCNWLLSDRASPRSRSGLNQQAVHLRPRHRCDQARHEPLFGRAALRAFRPIATQPPGITRHHTLALAENEFLAADRRRGLHITSVVGNFSDRIPKTIADWSSRIAARYPALA